ncbi:MAG: E3 binding domain-containing protein, partial [Candidatus Omnitrophica bacterium]|nr:E3 binding domain-containing protein [Candidatus Omnitrophota bacterium]
MATIIEMPKLSDTMTTGKIISWLKKEGDAIESGEAIAEVETDKATMELEVFEDGVLLKILAEKDSDAPIGAALAILGEEGEDITGLMEQAKSQTGEASVAEKQEEKEKVEEAPSTAAEAAGAAAAAPKQPPSSPAAKEEDGRIRISPVAQRIAAEKNVEIRLIQGSGPGGRIVKRDVEEFLEKGGVKPGAAPAPAAAP